MRGWRRRDVWPKEWSKRGRKEVEGEEEEGGARGGGGLKNGLGMTDRWERRKDKEERNWRKKDGGR